MNYYLIYQDSSVDEGSSTIIVGPFENKATRAIVRRDHATNNGGCWRVGVFDWEWAGEIDGEVTGYEITPPYELLNRYTRRDNKDSFATTSLFSFLAWFKSNGFPSPPDGWVR